MAGTRYLRYLVFVTICTALVFFISSSSAPARPWGTADTFHQAYGSTKPWPAAALHNHDGSSEENQAQHKSPSHDVLVSASQEFYKPPQATNPNKQGLSNGSEEEPKYHHSTNWWRSSSGKSNKQPANLAETASGKRMNATFVTLARNSDVWEIAESIRHLEYRFNSKFRYDWVFLNDQEFDTTFKEVTAKLVSGRARYGLIPKKYWSFPDFIDQDEAAKTREDMAKAGIKYGDSISYRHMCRFESGFFFWQDLMLEYDWYWRVEPGIELYCDIGYDIFKFMEDHGKKFSFVISLYEFFETIPTLWKSAKSFMRKFPQHIAKGNSMAFLSDDGGETFNNCHFWSNFEIGNLNWLRSQAYTDYFAHMDRAGGFFYERWGDAPIHSIAAGLLLQKEEIHFFNDIAYYHNPYTHCPTGEQYKLDHKCNCAKEVNFDWNDDSCTARFYELHGWAKPEGYLEDGEH